MKIPLPNARPFPPNATFDTELQTGSTYDELFHQISYLLGRQLLIFVPLAPSSLGHNLRTEPPNHQQLSYPNAHHHSPQPLLIFQQIHPSLVDVHRLPALTVLS